MQLKRSTTVTHSYNHRTKVKENQFDKQLSFVEISVRSIARSFAREMMINIFFHQKSVFGEKHIKVYRNNHCAGR